MVLAITALATGLLIFLVSLPLIYRKVPQNRCYGIRIEESFRSDSRWFEINEYGGRQFAKWSFLITGTGIAGFWVPPQHFVIYSLIVTAVTLIAVFVPLYKVLECSDRMRKEPPSNPGET